MSFERISASLPAVFQLGGRAACPRCGSSDHRPMPHPYDAAKIIGCSRAYLLDDVFVLETSETKMRLFYHCRGCAAVFHTEL